MLSHKDQEVVIKILSPYLQKMNASLYVFGSRAKDKARPDSDLDLLFDSHQSLSFEDLSDIREAFENSDLTYKVDLVERLNLSPAFLSHIEKDLVKL